MSGIAGFLALLENLAVPSPTKKTARLDCVAHGSSSGSQGRAGHVNRWLVSVLKGVICKLWKDLTYGLNLSQYVM